VRNSDLLKSCVLCICEEAKVFSQGRYARAALFALLRSLAIAWSGYPKFKPEEARDVFAKISKFEESADGSITSRRGMLGLKLSNGSYPISVEEILDSDCFLSPQKFQRDEAVRFHFFILVQVCSKSRNVRPRVPN